MRIDPRNLLRPGAPPATVAAVEELAAMKLPEAREEQEAELHGLVAGIIVERLDHIAADIDARHMSGGITKLRERYNGPVLRGTLDALREDQGADLEKLEARLAEQDQEFAKLNPSESAIRQWNDTRKEMLAIMAQLRKGDTPPPRALPHPPLHTGGSPRRPIMGNTFA